MKLKRLIINYFMSFGPTNVIDLSDRGLCLITGINEISDTASSNGAGKTNLQEALPWAIYGKTTKDVGVNDVVNNIHGKDCFVKAIFEDGESEYHIERYRKHSEHGDNLLFKQIKEDGTVENLSGVDKDETQKRIERFIGCGFTLFCNSSYFSQNNVKPFSTYTDRQIKEVFIDALDMGRFTLALEKARTDLKILREELSTLQGKKTRLEEEVEEARCRQEDYRKKHAEFDSQLKSDLASFDSDIEKLEVKIADLKTKNGHASTLLSAIEEYQKAAEKLPEILDSKTSLTKEVTNFKNSFYALNHKATDAERTLRTKTNELHSVSSRIGTNCSECGKPIVEADLGDVISGIKVQIEETSAELSKLKTLIEKATPKIGEYQLYEETIERQVADCRKAEKTIADLKIALARIDIAKREIAILEGNIRDLKMGKLKRSEEKSPWQAYVDKEQALIDEATGKIAAMETVVVEKGDEIKYSEYWENAFGYSGIPSFLLDTVTPFLNERANHHSTTVTGGEIEIDFSTVSKTKKGDLKDKFAINISHKNGAKKYRGISGGERKRADVCIAQSIQDLVRSFGRNVLSYCSYDEPFENLDEEGVSYVIEMLREISGEIGTVLVVTHSSELKAMFDHVITVIKGKDGYSRIMA